VRNSTLRNLLFTLPLANVLAQTPALQTNVVYVCTDGQSFKVFSCDSAAPNGVCDFQNYKNGQAFQRGQALRQQLASLVPAKCHAQSAAEAQSDPHRGEIPAQVPAKAPAVAQPRATAVAQNGATPAAAPRAATAPLAAPGNGQTGVGGFKVGDTVKINTAFGWMEAKVMQVNGASYYVHATSGADVWKPYPSEVRRIGPLNAEDRAHGLYDLHDRVQVRFEGKWVDSEVVTTFALGDRYEVKLPGDRTGYATPQDMRFVSVAPPPAVTKAGVAPKPGFTSCAGKIEGRYGSSNGGPGPRIVFQAGKAMVDDVLSQEQRECWTNGSQLILRLVGDATNGGQDITFDINKDGTLDSPLFGELKKKN
jgi:hypothetical protein